MVAEVGVRTNQSVINENAQSNLLDQARTAQQAYSGVTQVINAANVMFDSLLSAVRR